MGSRCLAVKPKIDSTAALAAYLGLSRWTVSRAINRHKEVKPETARRVNEAMIELGFTPSLFGRGLRGVKAPIIGVGFRRFNWPAFTEKLTFLHQALQDHQRQTIWETYTPTEAGTAQMIDHFLAMRVEGVVLIEAALNSALTRELARLKEARIACVLLDPLGAGTPNAVHIDREDALARATMHLLGLGHRHFGLLGIDDSFPFGQMRLNGIRRALLAFGESPERSLRIFSRSDERFRRDYGQILAASLLQQKPLPTALIALSDELALNAMWALQRAGVSVPGEVSIFGFDNLNLSELVSPSLSTIDQEIQTAVGAAAAMLFQLIEHPSAKNVAARRIAARLILRESIAPARRIPKATAASRRTAEG